MSNGVQSIISAFYLDEELNHFMQQVSSKQRLLALMQYKTTSTGLPLDIWEHLIAAYVQDQDLEKQMRLVGQAFSSFIGRYKAIRASYIVGIEGRAVPSVIIIWEMKQEGSSLPLFLSLLTKNGSWEAKIDVPFNNRSIFHSSVWSNTKEKTVSAAVVVQDDEECLLLFEFIQYFVDKLSGHIRKAQDYLLSL
jgi:hypothetical protein